MDNSKFPYMDQIWKATQRHKIIMQPKEIKVTMTDGTEQKFEPSTKYGESQSIKEGKDTKQPGTTFHNIPTKHEVRYKRIIEICNAVNNRYIYGYGDIENAWINELRDLCNDESNYRRNKPSQG